VRFDLLAEQRKKKFLIDEEVSQSTHKQEGKTGKKEAQKKSKKVCKKTKTKTREEAGI